MTLSLDVLFAAQQTASAASLLYAPREHLRQRLDAYAVAVSPHRQSLIAAAYRAAPADGGRPETLAAFRAFRDETLRQLDAIQLAGLSVHVSNVDPYDGPAELFADVAHGRISVLSTRATGGHVFLTDDENDAFRAVHDVLGHAFTGRGFDRHGEEAAYRAHSRLYSPLARRALATETRGQNAALIATGSFQDQKLALLPSVMSDPSYLIPSEREHADALTDARARHAAQSLPATF